jgi:hypothetical protein
LGFKQGNVRRLTKPLQNAPNIRRSMLMFFSARLSSGLASNDVHYTSFAPTSSRTVWPARWTSWLGSLQVKSRALTTPMDYERRSFS